jgi:hypothetical protein
MDAKIINWDKAPSGNDVEVLSTFYAFLKITDYFARKGGIDHIHELKLFNGKEVKVSEEGFREWLKGIVSVQWNETELTRTQIVTLNMIQDYLKVPYNQDDQPIVTGDSYTFDDLIKEQGEGR